LRDARPCRGRVVVSFEDLLLAKLCTQSQLAPIAALRETLRAMDKPGATGGLFCDPSCMASSVAWAVPWSPFRRAGLTPSCGCRRRTRRKTVEASCGFRSLRVPRAVSITMFTILPTSLSTMHCRVVEKPWKTG